MLRDVGSPALITLPNSGTEAQRKHTMVGSSGKVVITCVSTVDAASRIVNWASDADAAVAPAGAVPPGMSQLKPVGGAGSYVSVSADADFLVLIQEVE